MDSNFYFFDFLAGLLYLVVGMRLHSLSRRTKARPEYLLAVHYLCTGGSYLLYELPAPFAQTPEWILLVARLIYTVGMVPLLFFTRETFRRDTSWATVLVWANLLVLFSGATLSALEGDTEGVVVTSIWFWFDWIGYTVPYVWITTEALLAYGAAQKRVRLGICEPEVANRFLLWALFGALATIAGALLIPLYIEYATTQIWPEWGNYASGGFEAASTLALWFVFFPPAFYRRWINRAAHTGVVAKS